MQSEKWLIITIAVVTSIALISAASVAIVFILSKQALEIEAKVQKRMVSINSEKFWTSEESNNVNFHGQIDVEKPDQSIRGNLTILHHKATLEDEFDKIEIEQIHEEIRISVMCSTILCGIIGHGIFLMCIIKGFKGDRVSKRVDAVLKDSNDLN